MTREKVLPFPSWSLPLVATVAVATVFLNIPSVAIPYHRWQMERAFISAWTVPPHEGTLFAVPATEYDRFEYHRDRLVTLGAIRRITLVFKKVQTPTDRSKSILTALQKKKCPEYIDFSSTHPAVPSPLSITIWCEPETAKAWAAFLQARDVD